MRKQSGLTLVEVLTTAAIVSILYSVAAPHLMRSTSPDAGPRNAATALLTDLTFARNEAVRRAAVVSMCPSGAPQDPHPVCVSADSAPGSGWAGGWLTFIDNDSSRDFSDGDQLLRRRDAFEGLNSHLQSGTAAATGIEFTSLGNVRATASGSVQFQSVREPASSSTVCIMAAGWARVALAGVPCP